jgi:hypothetical protein
MMTTSLDKLKALETWQATTEESLGTLLKSSSATAARVETVSRVSRLEFRPPPPPPPPPPPHWNLRDQHQPPQPTVAGLDLNRALAASSSVTPPRVELPYGHGYDNQIRDAGGGLLGGPPPRPGNGTPHDSAPHIQLLQDSPHHHPPFPKIEFPKFDGANPRLWRDLCECYFEVYAVHTAMKTRFATLTSRGQHRHGCRRWSAADGLLTGTSCASW